MSPLTLPSRDMLDRLLAAAVSYREAFHGVEAAIEAERNPDLPSWVFNLERLTIEEIRAKSPNVARAEAIRRASRAALHATAELVALDDPGAALAAGQEPLALPAAIRGNDPTAVAASLQASDDPHWRRVLDRFVGIVNRADDGGCLYLDGRFVPLETHDGEDEGTGVTEISRLRRDED